MRHRSKAMTWATTGAISRAFVATEQGQSSSYRAKFRRDQFLELVEYSSTKVIYRRGKSYFFASDGFVMYCQECKPEDFASQKLFETTEFSNTPWTS